MVKRWVAAQKENIGCRRTNIRNQIIFLHAIALTHHLSAIYNMSGNTLR